MTYRHKIDRGSEIEKGKQSVEKRLISICILLQSINWKDEDVIILLYEKKIYRRVKFIIS